MDIGGEQLTAGITCFAAIGICLSLFFEFINEFHDTANAVATVIYTHSLPPTVAVIWSGIWNFIGVLLSSGAVAYSVVAILPPSLRQERLDYALKGSAGQKVKQLGKTGNYRCDRQYSKEQACNPVDCAGT